MPPQQPEEQRGETRERDREATSRQPALEKKARMMPAGTAAGSAGGAAVEAAPAARGTTRPAEAADPPIPPKRWRGRPPKYPRGDVAAISRGEINELTRITDEPDPEVERDQDAERFEARQKHIGQLRDMDVFVAEPRQPGQSKPLSLKWVDRPDKMPATARLTARGYEQLGTKGVDFYAGTPVSGSLRMLVALAAHRGWTIGAGDADRAFLQAWLPEDDPPIFVWPPAEAEEMPGYVWRLQKALPGLEGSAQVWGGHASDALLREHDLKQSGADE